MTKKKSKEESPEVESPKVKVVSTEELQSQVCKLESELRECRDYKDKYWRLLAEAENTRKRLTKEKHEHTKFTIQDVILDFLLPLEQFEKALSFTDSMSPDVKNWAIGFNMILDKFKDVLVSKGVTAYHASVGKVFDPHLHEAIETVDTEDYPNGAILEEFAPGYKLEDRVIRAAHVKVVRRPEPVEKAVAPEEIKEEEIKEQQGE